MPPLPAQLILSDGTRFVGESFGASRSTSGEVVFATGMVGYPEAFTDPSFQGQIVTMTYPMMGNYGVGTGTFESLRGPHIQGLIVQSEAGQQYSHVSAQYALGEWLKQYGIPAIRGIDTRALTVKLREHGVMLGQIVVGNERPITYIEDPNTRNLVAEVSVTAPEWHGEGKKTVIAVDTGMKQSILDQLVSRGVRVKRVPWNYDYTQEEWDGLFLSNGPGDPQVVKETIQHVKRAMKLKKPIFGICLGSQIMGLASGARTYKLRYGHRSQNQPCIDVSTGKCYLTTQNHGFAVDQRSLKAEWKVWFVNANDQSVEGIRHKTLPYWSVQFHPEATPGPEDTLFLFDDFIDRVKGV